MKVKKLILFSLAVLVLSSCATTGANQFLISNTSNQAKAELLFETGVDRYQKEIVQQENIYAIKEVRAFFDNVLVFNSTHPKAKAYIELIDSFQQKKINSFLQTSTSLLKIQSRSKKQDYDLVIAVSSLRTMDPLNSEYSKLETQTKEIKTALVSERELVLTEWIDQQNKKNPDKLSSQKKTEIQTLITELQSLDQRNSTAHKAQKLLASKIAEETTTTQQTAVQHSKQTAKKTTSVQKSAPSLQKTADDLITETLASIDAAIAKDNLSAAYNTIASEFPKLQKQANKDALTQRKEQVMSKLKSLYLDGVALYNQEDYTAARLKFRTVISIESSYEQAQAYLERCESKIKALSGKN